jgi:hypothetical protein
MPEMDLLARISRFSQSAAGRLRVRSALNPFLWMGSVFSVICFGTAAAFRSLPVVVYILVGLGGIPILVACGVGIYFAGWKSERLHSEDYQIRAQALRLIEEKGGRIKVDPASVEGIARSGRQPARAGDERSNEAER